MIYFTSICRGTRYEVGQVGSRIFISIFRSSFEVPGLDAVAKACATWHGKDGFIEIHGNPWEILIPFFFLEVLKGRKGFQGVGWKHYFCLMNSF